MEKMRYESPEFNFQEMQLMETVADTCWGYGHGWYDVDGDGTHDETEEMFDFGFAGGKCKKVENYLVEYINSNYENVHITGDDVKTNSNSQLVKPVVS